MREIVLDVTDFALKGKNDLVAMNRSRPYGLAYSRYRDSIYALMFQYRNRGTAMTAVELEIVVRTLRPVDVDSKYAMCSVLLDVLQPDRIITHPRRKVVPGLGWIANDTDGEGGNNGVIKSLRVIQKSGYKNGGFTIYIREVATSDEQVEEVQDA